MVTKNKLTDKENMKNHWLDIKKEREKKEEKKIRGWNDPTNFFVKTWEELNRKDKGITTASGHIIHLIDLTDDKDI